MSAPDDKRCAELAAVISAAMLNHKPADGPPSVCVAAAVRAHMASEAVVERMARAAYRVAVIKGVSLPWVKHDEDTREHWRRCIRAALAAAGEG